ncbi:hypothetical protein [Polymorphospora rubra]|uniref:Uncharacterized protein n=1 Tax=Polymorphospora rubra TaxID=338584 RepID=A0A810N9B9_9ACTN|nr:hypothetical protein [Polymorphospora rubra]BCJ69650.1 hypothetical protein Prubr_66710 [Polymorphospora rubra]
MRIDLPDPDVMMARWGAIASAMATLGEDDPYRLEDGIAQFDDGSGNGGWLRLIEGGRAVLYGSDDTADFGESVDEIDLLAGAPDWLPLPDLIRCTEEGRVTFVYWYDGGWSRVPYPDGTEDGLRMALNGILTAESARRELLEVVFCEGQHEPQDDPEKSAVSAAADRLLAAADSRSVDRAALHGLLGRVQAGPVDICEGLLVAAAFGLTAASTPPVAVPRQAGPPPDRIQVLRDRQVDELLWNVVQEAAELSRPMPAPGPELAELVEWVRKRAGADGRCSRLFRVLDGEVKQRPDEMPQLGPLEDSPASNPSEEAIRLVRRLWAAEADPVYGHWLYIRVEVDADGFTVDRWYDSSPDWVGPVSWARGLWRERLRTEMARRAPEYRPPWTVLLDPDVLYAGVPEPFAAPVAG